MTKQEILNMFSDIDFVYNNSSKYETLSMMLDELLKEQKPKHGKWITIWLENDPYISSSARCSICNRVGERPLGKFCKWCGAEMDAEEKD